MRFHYCSLCANVNDTLLSTSRREYRHGSSLLTCRFALLRSLTAENVRCSHTMHIHIRVLFLSSSNCVSFNSRQNCWRVNQKRRNTGIRDILETICIGLDGNLIFEQNPQNTGYIQIEMLLKSFNTSIFQLFLTIISRNKFFFIRYSSLIIFNLAVSFSFF